jgi:hypothetical protein
MVAKSKTTKAVAEQRKSTEIIAFDPSADSGMGMEGTTQESFAIPFLAALQKISPQVEETDAAYIKGAKAGQIFESVSKKLYDGVTGVLLVPCAYRRTFIRWAPRGAESGGFKGEYAPEVVAAMRENGDVLELDNRLYFPLEDGTINPKRCDYLSDTRNHYVLIVDGDEVHECLLSLKSTQIKKSKIMMSMLAGKKSNGKVLPTFATMVRATTALEKNDEGQWYGINLSEEGPVTDAAIYNAAKAFHKSVAAGAVKANYEESPAEKF